MAKVLLIDDDIDFIDTLRIAVESGGYTVETANSGEEGLEKVRQSTPDLIVLDVMMGGIDGWEVCSTLKSSEHKSIPIIMLTAVASEIKNTRYTQEDALETDADDYIPKPVEPYALLERIDRFLK